MTVDHLGNVIVVWLADGSGTLLRARRHSVADGTWQTPVDLTVADTVRAGDPIAAVDAAGNVFALWVQGGLFASRYSAATNSWGEPVVITPAPASPDCTFRSGQVAGSYRIRVAVDPLGRAFVAWTLVCRDPGQLGAYTFAVHAARYAPDAGVVTEAVLSAPASGLNVDADVAVDALGNATVIWPEPGPAYTTVRAATYTAATGAWSAPASVLPDPSDTYVDGVRVANDALGHLTAVWRVNDARNSGMIRAARYDASSRVWMHMADLDAVASPLGVWQPTLAVDPAGNAVAIWEVSESVNRHLRAAVYDAGAGTWGAAIDLSPPGNFAPRASVATDALGNVTAVWSERFGPDIPNYRIRTARLTSGGVATVADLATGIHESVWLAAVGVGAGGHAAVAWSHGRAGLPQVVGVVEWQATPARPTIASIMPGDGALTVSVTPPVAREPGFAAIYYDYSVDAGATWTTRVPASTISPVRIGGLTNGVAYTIRVRAVNAAGPGAASAAVVATPLPAPGAPTGLVVAAREGRRVTLQWRPPVAGAAVTGYVIQGGGEPGEVVASVTVASGLPTLTFDAPPGAFYVRVHAVAGPAWSPPSNEVRVYVDMPLRPSPPRDLRRLANGSSVSLSWRNTFEQGAPTGVLLRVSSPQGSSTIALPVVETFRLDGVPAGTYVVQVTAVNAAGESGFGSQAQVVVPASCADATQGPPHAPTGFVAATSGRSYHLAWEPPATGPALESYIVQVGGSFTGATPTTSRVLSGVAPPGAYTISVAARNSCGIGPSTASMTIVIP